LRFFSIVVVVVVIVVVVVAIVGIGGVVATMAAAVAAAVAAADIDFDDRLFNFFSASRTFSDSRSISLRLPLADENAMTNTQSLIYDSSSEDNFTLIRVRRTYVLLYDCLGKDGSDKFHDSAMTIGIFQTNDRKDDQNYQYDHYERIRNE
jgi:hypothetical protein